MKISNIQSIGSATEQSERCSEIVKLHTTAFSGFFLTSLGTKFLRLLYGGFITQENGICLVAEDSGKVVGFAAGTTDPDNFFRNLLKQQGIKFALAAIQGLLRNPFFVIRKCFGALFYRGEQPKELPNAALLNSLAVSSNTGGKGIGQSLVRAFCDEARNKKCKAVYLTTDESENESVNRFYEKCGFELTDTLERTGKRTMNRWVIML